METSRSPKIIGYLAVGGLGFGAFFTLLDVITWLGILVAQETVVGALRQGSAWVVLITGVGLFSFPIKIATIIVFLVWMYRASNNLRPLGASFLEFSPGWAVGWWFVPFANLVKPYQAIREIWCESNPEVTDPVLFSSPSLRVAPAFIGIWWGCWIVGNILTNISSRMASPGNLDWLMPTAIVSILAGIFTIIAAALAAKIVLGISDGQESKAQLARPVYSSAPPPPSQYEDQILPDGSRDDQGLA